MKWIKYWYQRLIMPLLLFFITKKEDIEKPWLRWNLETAFQKEAFNMKQKEITPLPESFLKEVKENADNLDKHMLYVAGGALTLFIFIFDEGQSSQFAQDELFAIRLAFLGFILCLWLVVTSYFLINNILPYFRKLQVLPEMVNIEFQKLTKMEKAGEENITHWQRVVARRDLELVWDEMRRCSIISTTIIPLLNNIVNTLSYLAFSFAVTCIFVFAFNFLFS